MCARTCHPWFNVILTNTFFLMQLRGRVDDLHRTHTSTLDVTCVFTLSVVQRHDVRDLHAAAAAAAATFWLARHCRIFKLPD